MKNSKEKFYTKPYDTKHSITEKNKKVYEKHLTMKVETDIIKEKLNKKKKGEKR